MFKYLLLKSSWGIVIFIDFEEILNPQILAEDIELSKYVYLRIEGTFKLNNEALRKYLSRGLKDISDLIYEKVKQPVCFQLKDLDFNYAHFQEEGLYCAAQKWIGNYYNIPIKDIDVEFNNITNKYVFNFPD